MKLKPIQREDLARAALHDGLILAWDCGLGKTLGSILWSLLKVGEWTDPNGRLMPQAPVLIIGPNDGFEHWSAEARLLSVDLIALESQADFERLSNNGRDLPPAFYYTNFTQLAHNGVTDPPDTTEAIAAWCQSMQWHALASASEQAFDTHQAGNFGPDNIHCVFSPTLADLCANTFAAVLVDEAVAMKGADSLIGLGIRQLHPRYRLVCTATPIKNRLPDIFYLAWWAAGARAQPHARWPFGGQKADQTSFAETFLIQERNLTKEAILRASGKPGRRRKFTAQICNIHGLWKLLAPMILRRRKKDMSDIPPKVRHLIRVPLGTAQKETYLYHLSAPYKDENGKAAIGAKLQALRVAAANPASPLLHAVYTSASSELAHTHAHCRSHTDYTPKYAAALSLIQRILSHHEQVVVFSAFHSATDGLAARLTQACVPHLSLDGRIKPAQRGKLAMQFKSEDVPLMLAGLDSMAKMHSFPKCQNIILLAYSWAWDSFEQAINRIHRINSPAPVNIWSIICDGSIDRMLEELIHEKGDASELVIDGQLLSETHTEVNLRELLDTAQSDFQTVTETIHETDLEAQWPALRDRLRIAASQWRDPEIIAPIVRIESVSEQASTPPPPPLVTPAKYTSLTSYRRSRLHSQR